MKILTVSQIRAAEEVVVKIARADLDKKQLDFALVEKK